MIRNDSGEAENSIRAICLKFSLVPIENRSRVFYLYKTSRGTFTPE